MNISLEVVLKVLDAANEVGPLPEWTRTSAGAEDVLRQMEQEAIDAGCPEGNR